MKSRDDQSIAATLPHHEQTHRIALASFASNAGDTMCMRNQRVVIENCIESMRSDITPVGYGTGIRRRGRI